MAIYVLGFSLAIGSIGALFIAWLIHQLRRQSNEIEQRIDVLEIRQRTREQIRLRRSKASTQRPGLPANSILNDFELPDLRGGTVTFSQWRGQPIAVFFVQPDCPFSRQLIDRFATERSMLENERQLIVVSSGDWAVNHEFLKDLPPDVPRLLQQANELARIWRVPVTPAGYLFDRFGVTEGHIVRGEQECINALSAGDAPGIEIDSQRWKRETTRFIQQFKPNLTRLETGSPASLDLLLPCLDPDQTMLLEARRTLLVLSDPGCTPCLKLLPDLELRYRQLDDETRLLMVSRGEQEHLAALRAEYEVTFPIVSQPAGALNRALGIVDTPAAILIGRDRRVLSPAVVGRDEILSLLEHVIAGAV